MVRAAIEQGSDRPSRIVVLFSVVWLCKKAMRIGENGFIIVLLTSRFVLI